MNKIVIDKPLNNLIINDKIVYIKGRVSINKIDISNIKEGIIVLEDNASLIIHDIIDIEGINGNLSIISNNNTNLDLGLGISSKGKNTFNIINRLVGNNNKSNIKIRVVSEEYSYINMKLTGIIESNTKNNDYTEDIKYLNLYPETIICLPELIVNSNDTVANHLMSVGNVNGEELFYLESRGINKKDSIEMIKRGFLNI
jgi:Fe-S cluster assembly protein SufD